MVVQEALAGFCRVLVLWLTGANRVGRCLSCLALLSNQLWQFTELAEGAFVVESERLWNSLELILSWLLHCVTSAREGGMFLRHGVVNTLQIAVRVALVLHVVIFQEQVINV